MPRAAIADPNTDATTDAPTKRKYIRRAPDVMDAPRRETHSTDFTMGQHSTITDKTERNDVGREKFDALAYGKKAFGSRFSTSGDIILLKSEGENIEVTPEYLEELAFYEDPITIIINASTHKNAASIFENWCNGIGAEMLINGKWVQVRDLPVGKEITIKRKIVEHIIRARVVDVKTVHENSSVDYPRNEIQRSASHVHSFSLIHDPSPRSREWLSMAYARPI